MSVICCKSESHVCCSLSFYTDFSLPCTTTHLPLPNKFDSECTHGFAGRDCSFPVNLCPADDNNSGIRACFNGGKCFAEPDSDGVSFKWKCDCSEAFGDPSNYNNEQCSFPDQFVSCERNKTNSEYAFCVNGGSCGDNVVNSGEIFRGCTCSQNFEGRHCQYAAGTSF